MSHSRYPQALCPIGCYLPTTMLGKLRNSDQGQTVPRDSTTAWTQTGLKRVWRQDGMMIPNIRALPWVPAHIFNCPTNICTWAAYQSLSRPSQPVMNECVWQDGYNHWSCLTRIRIWGPYTYLLSWYMFKIFLNKKKLEVNAWTIDFWR